MIQTSDLPSRRNEAWKYSDLRAALADFLLPEEAARPKHAWGKLDGIVERLALAQGRHELTKVRAGEEDILVERIGGGGGLEASVREIQVLPGGALTRIVIQAGGEIVLNAAHVDVAEGAMFRQFVLATGGKLARVETQVTVEGGGEVELNGVYMCATGRHADLTSVITHIAAGSETRQLIKGVAAKGGRGVFQGKIVVERAAQRTDARQHHQGMLLEGGAEIFAKPELMIYADDVQCAHGNTAGGLDEAAKFYLRSRGVPAKEAQAMLVEAFLVGAIPDSLPSDMDDEIRARVASWLEAHA